MPVVASSNSFRCGSCVDGEECMGLVGARSVSEEPLEEVCDDENVRFGSDGTDVGTLVALEDPSSKVGSRHLTISSGLSLIHI